MMRNRRKNKCQHTWLDHEKYMAKDDDGRTLWVKLVLKCSKCGDLKVVRV